MKKIITIILALIVAPTALAGSIQFKDVKDSEIYKDGIEYLANQGLINGHPDGTYKPHDTINRAEIVKILIETKAIYSDGGRVASEFYTPGCFPDVQAGAWYEGYVCLASDLGWVQGYQDGTFKPEQAVSFVEALKIVYKSYEFEYDSNDAPWYRDLVEQASENNYIPHTISSFNDGLQRNKMADLVTRIEKDHDGHLQNYLGDRANIVVTYETIFDGLDLSKMEVFTLCADGSDCN